MNDDRGGITVPGSSMVARAAHEQLATLFELGGRLASMLDVEELLHTIPEFVARVLAFDAFAVYLLDERRQDLRIGYSVGYPPGVAEQVRLRVGEGLVGGAVAERRSILVNDVNADARYMAFAHGMRSALVVPLVYHTKTVGALNILSHQVGAYAPSDPVLLRQFGVHVAVALENARLFEQQRRDAVLFETLAAVGREVSSILELDELLTRIAQLARKIVDYRTFGIMLLDEAQRVLEMKVAVQYAGSTTLPKVRLGEGLVGYAALHKQPVLVADVSRDPRYIKVLEDVRSELVVPLLYKDRCVGVFDLESPELDAFGDRDVDALALLASQAAVAIENARLYETVRANEDRLDREVRFAQRVQSALLPAPPVSVRGVQVAARFTPARELGGDFYDFLTPEARSLVVVVGDVSGKGVPAALYSAFAAELVRSRTFRRRYAPERATPAGVLAAVNSILNARQLEEYFCSLAFAAFDLERRMVSLSNSGLPYPLRCVSSRCEPVEVPGVPLGAFPSMTYDEVTFPLAVGDVYIFFTDGVTEAMNPAGAELTVQPVIEVVERLRESTAADIVEGVCSTVERFRGECAATDDVTVVAVKITG